MDKTPEELERTDLREYVALRVRAAEVSLGSASGWQVQTRPSYKGEWVSKNVMCSKEEAEAEVARLRENLVRIILEMP